MGSCMTGDVNGPSYFAPGYCAATTDTGGQGWLWGFCDCFSYFTKQDCYASGNPTCGWCSLPNMCDSGTPGVPSHACVIWNFPGAAKVFPRGSWILLLMIIFTGIYCSFKCYRGWWASLRYHRRWRHFKLNAEKDIQAVMHPGSVPKAGPLREHQQGVASAFHEPFVLTRTPSQGGAPPPV